MHASQATKSRRASDPSPIRQIVVKPPLTKSHSFSLPGQNGSALFPNSAVVVTSALFTEAEEKRNSLSSTHKNHAVGVFETEDELPELDSQSFHRTNFSWERIVSVVKFPLVVAVGLTLACVAGVLIHTDTHLKVIKNTDSPYASHAEWIDPGTMFSLIFLGMDVKFGMNIFKQNKAVMTFERYEHMPLPIEYILPIILTAFLAAYTDVINLALYCWYSGRGGSIFWDRKIAKLPTVWAKLKKISSLSTVQASSTKIKASNAAPRKSLDIKFNNKLDFLLYFPLLVAGLAAFSVQQSGAAQTDDKIKDEFVDNGLTILWAILALGYVPGKFFFRSTINKWYKFDGYIKSGAYMLAPILYSKLEQNIRFDANGILYVLSDPYSGFKKFLLTLGGLVLAQQGVSTEATDKLKSELQNFEIETLRELAREFPEFFIEQKSQFLECYKSSDTLKKRRNMDYVQWVFIGVAGLIMIVSPALLPFEVAAPFLFPCVAFIGSYGIANFAKRSPFVPRNHLMMIGSNKGTAKTETLSPAITDENKKGDQTDVKGGIGVHDICGYVLDQFDYLLRKNPMLLSANFILSIATNFKLLFKNRALVINASIYTGCSWAVFAASFLESIIHGKLKSSASKLQDKDLIPIVKHILKGPYDTVTIPKETFDEFVKIVKTSKDQHERNEINSHPIDLDVAMMVFICEAVHSVLGAQQQAQAKSTEESIRHYQELKQYISSAINKTKEPAPKGLTFFEDAVTSVLLIGLLIKQLPPFDEIGLLRL